VIGARRNRQIRPNRAVTPLRLRYGPRRTLGGCPIQLSQRPGCAAQLLLSDSGVTDCISSRLRASAARGGGVSIVPAGIDTSSPAFKTAWSACSTLLPGLGAHQGASAQATEQLLKLSECMRSHGVTGFPDPTSAPPAGFPGPAAGAPAGHSYSAVIRRGGAYLAIPDTINTASPSYRQAAAACRFGPTFS